VLIYATEEQLTDTNIISLPGKLAQYAAEEIRFMTGDAIFNGTGVGQPTGIIEHPGTVTVDPENGQAADTIRFENLVKMRARFLRVGGSPAWFANQDILPQLYSIGFPTSNTPLLLNVAAGSPSLGQELQQSLMGLPIYFTEFNPTLGTKGDIMLCDMKAYKTVTRGTVNSAVSIHVRFEWEETAFRFSFRVDGQPWLDSAVTPYKGSNTLAPFVQLADR
jgi:HK97 family phage major capsid protein